MTKQVVLPLEMADADFAAFRAMNVGFGDTFHFVMPVTASEAECLRVYGPEATLIQVNGQYHNLVRNSAGIGGDCRMVDVTEVAPNTTARDRWVYRVFGPAGTLLGNVALKLWEPTNPDEPLMSERMATGLAKGWAWFLGNKYVKKDRPRTPRYGALEFVITSNPEYN